MSNKINVKVSLDSDYKVFCENCRHGEDSTFEEYEEYINDISDMVLFIDDVFVANKICEYCGANTWRVIAKLKFE